MVTGAARRVGRHVALSLARTGFDLVIHYNTSAAQAQEVADLVRQAARQAITVQADLMQSHRIRAMFRDIEAHFGRLDLLVNNASIFEAHDPYELDEESFDEHIAVNLRAPYLCSIHAVRLMREGDGGCIINVADVAWERPFTRHIAYCVSKAGLVMLTRAMAKAYAPKVRVNAVAPGTVLFREDEGLRRRIEAKTPMGKIGSPGDVADAIVFLARARHITGAVLPVDGGRSLA